MKLFKNLVLFYSQERLQNIEVNIFDKYCFCRNFCLIVIFDVGIKAKEGVFEQIVLMCFKWLVNVMFYDIIYFLIKNIIMINLFFGTILGTFSKMKKEERECDNNKIYS